MKRNVDAIIIGAGSVGGHIASNFQEYSSSNLLGFLDDDLMKKDTVFAGYPVLGAVGEITRYSREIEIIVGIAFPKIKKRVVKKLRSSGYTNFPSLVSKFSWISKDVQIGHGSILYPGSTVNYNSRIGDFVVINMNSSIGHDCHLNDFSSLAPNVSLGGNTVVGNGSELGIGSMTIQNITIGEEVVIGGGAVIIRNVPKCTVMVGNPARSI